MKPLPKILIGLACLAVFVFGRWYFWSSLFPAPAQPEAASREAMRTVPSDMESGEAGAELSPIAEARRRAIAGFRARLAHAQQLREQAIFPSDEELLTLWDLPPAERERVLQTRREMVAEAVQRMSEASAEEAAAWRELKALGLDEEE